MKTNTITVTVLPDATQAIADAAAARFECDLVQYLKIEGIDLPDAYQVDFCNIGDDETITMVGGADGVIIPDQLIQAGLPIVAYLYLQTGTDSWNTMVQISIPVISRPERSDIQPTPAEQSTIDTLVAALNNAVKDGVGIPAGGTAGQVLTKQSDADYDAEWEDGGGGGGNIVVVNFTYSAQPYSLTADKTYQEVKEVIDAGGFAVAIVNHDYSMYNLSSVNDYHISFMKRTFTSAGNSGVKIATTTFTLLASGGCGSSGGESTYGGNYPIETLRLVETGNSYTVKDYEITRLDSLFNSRRYDFQLWVYPSENAYDNGSGYEVYRLQKLEKWYDGDTQLNMTAGEFMSITDGKVKKIRIEMDEYGEWYYADFTYTETAL